MGNPSPETIDVSIVLNAHREAVFLPRTLDSLDEAARYARTFGLNCEMVVVEDRADMATRNLFSFRDFSAYHGCKILEVDNGSLGRSRNDGIAAASGDFVMIADADDLVSFNMIAECFFAAAASPERALFFPNYYLAFGANPHLYEMHPLAVTTPHALAGYHPYVSRMFVRRTDIAGLEFADLRLSEGFAYEDWHFNLQAAGAGFDLRVVPETIVFYRKRPGSLLMLADHLSNGVTAYAPYFDPPNFLRRFAPYGETAKAALPVELIDSGPIRSRFLANPACRELTKAAALIEPAIDPGGIHGVHAFSNLNYARSVGVAYQAVCERIAGVAFDELLLVPFLSTGGGEKYVLHVVLSLLEQNPGARLLILSGEPFEAHAWLDRLPPSVTFLDLYALAPHLDAKQREVLTLRTIQACGKGSRLHIKSCPYAVDFLRRFASVLHDNKIVYYRFCDAHELFYGEWIRRGYEFDFLSDCGAWFDKIVTDNDCIRHFDVARMPHLERKYATLHNYVEADICACATKAPTRRVLWASRLDAQKRPDLLPLIADALLRRAPDVVMDVYGSPVMNAFDFAELENLENLRYCGPFDRFSALDLDRYDLFVYTSAFDGLPNVVLEAMAAGLPVIATDVGGISEAVTADSGVLLDPALADDDLAHAYAEAIAGCCDDPDRISKLRSGALAAIAARHKKSLFDKTVATLFNLDTTAAAGDAVAASSAECADAPVAAQIAM